MRLLGMILLRSLIEIKSIHLLLMFDLLESLLIILFG